MIDLPDKAEARHATLRITADDKFTVWLNGKELGSGDDWHMPVTIDVAKTLKAGKHVLAVRAENVKAPVAENPAGLSVGLEIELADGAKTTLHTDASWRVSKTEAENWRDAAFDDSKWPAALVAAKFGDLPWGRIGQESNNSLAPQACGIGDQLRVAYMLDVHAVTVLGLAATVKYRLTLFDPVTGLRGAHGNHVRRSRDLSCRSAQPRSRLGTAVGAIVKRHAHTD